MQLCIRKEEPTPYEDAISILERVRKKIPGVKIYVSSLAEYTNGTCKITGIQGIERGKELVEELTAKNADVLRGPILGPMTPEDTYEDGCHLSVKGMQKLGVQTAQFFDGKITA